MPAGEGDAPARATVGAVGYVGVVGAFCDLRERLASECAQLFFACSFGEFQLDGHQRARAAEEWRWGGAGWMSGLPYPASRLEIGSAKPGTPKQKPSMDMCTKFSETRSKWLTDLRMILPLCL